MNCEFCEICAGRSPAVIRDSWDDAIAIEPLNPVTEGHVLIVPRSHVFYATHIPYVTGLAFQRAAEYAVQYPWDFNLITSQGPNASQTVYHLHVHVVPRRSGDGLTLPWTAQS
jgi:histidine triad (HIT) family protein